MGRLTSKAERICGNCSKLDSRHWLGGNSYGPWCKKHNCGVSVYEEGCADFSKRRKRRKKG